MKVKRIILALVLTALCGFGWFVQLNARADEKKQFLEEITAGRDYATRELYQRAVQRYEAALSIWEDCDTRLEMLGVYAQAYTDGVITRNAYKNALEKACGLYPECAECWEALVSLLRDTNNFREAYKVLERANRAGTSSETLAAADLEIRYSFTERGQYFTQYRDAANGYVTICNSDKWGVLAPDGDVEYHCDYLYISPYSDDNAAVFRTADSIRLLDAKQVVQAILTEEITEARAYGNGLLPVFLDEKWRYLDCESGAYRSEQYDDASSFQGGTAAVRQGESWKLVDNAGSLVTERVFTDLNLYGNGSYCFDGRFTASSEGSWGLYRSDGTPEFELSAHDMDLYLGGWIAFQDSSGLWGFTDSKGEIMIEPRYQQAKSFSGGLAAVSNGEKWGFINEKGEIAIDFQFQSAGYFTNGGACPVSTVDGQFHMITLRFPRGG